MKKHSGTIAYIFLGVLLIVAGCFVVYTIMKPTPMKLVLPEESDQPATTTKAGLTLLLIQKDELYYFTQDNLHNGRIIPLKDVRAVLIDVKAQDSNLMVVIKPTEKASYRNTVDILDEMTINNIKKYAMVEPTKEELEFLERVTKQ